jgi:hypothetical protein
MSAQLRRRWITALAVGMVLLFTSSTIALGQDSKPSGTVTIHQVQVAFIGSGALRAPEHRRPIFMAPPHR